MEPAKAPWEPPQFSLLYVKKSLKFLSNPFQNVQEFVKFPSKISAIK
jgi:hypothetical protein